MESPMNESLSGFHILPFGVDGQPVGRGFWSHFNLSQHWLATCLSHLNANGEVFDAPWPGNLSHIRTKLTSAAGTAIVTFYVSSRIVASSILLAGSSPAAERDVSGMLVESLRNCAQRWESSRSPEAFEAIITAAERPLMAVVAWPESTVSEQDHDLVRELALHLAAAFFTKRW